jgi:hypothetical protein
VEVPRRGSVAAASAKDAFFYLLIFATLATWTIGFGSLAFDLIDRWVWDPLFPNYQQSYDSYSMAWALAALLVAFPLYLFISRIAAGETTRQPEKLDSPVRKWLTYLALVIAACVFMGDLITVLNHLLRGELTARFTLKACVVLGLSAGVFFYYFSGLRRADTAQARLRRDRSMVAASTAIVATIVILGFWQLGTPGTQRQIRADAQRVQQLAETSNEIGRYWSAHQQLPESLNTLPAGALEDPVTHTIYEYHSGRGSQYQLCAAFARASDARELAPEQSRWTHPAGHHCFTRDATEAPQYPVPYATF